MSPGQMLPGQMSQWQMASVKDGPRNLPLKFGQNRATNSWDIYFSGWVELVAEPMCRVGGVGCGAYVSVGEIENKAISTSIDLNWIELNWVEIELGNCLCHKSSWQFGKNQHRFGWNIPLFWDKCFMDKSYGRGVVWREQSAHFTYWFFMSELWRCSRGIL